MISPTSRTPFIPANVVTHEEVTEGHELLASEGFCEEIGGIVVGPDMEHFQQAVTHVVSYVVPARFESFVVDVDRGVVGGEHRSFVVAKNGWRKLSASRLQSLARRGAAGVCASSKLSD